MHDAFQFKLARTKQPQRFTRAGRREQGLDHAPGTDHATRRPAGQPSGLMFAALMTLDQVSMSSRMVCVNCSTVLIGAGMAKFSATSR